MFLRLELYQGALLVGMQQVQCFQEHTTPEIWARYMPQVAGIPNRIDHCLLSAEVYDADFFNPFDSSKRYSKWVGVRVLPFTETPLGLSHLTIPKGLYAFFCIKVLGRMQRKPIVIFFLNGYPNLATRWTFVPILR